MVCGAKKFYVLFPCDEDKGELSVALKIEMRRIRQSW